MQPAARSAAEAGGGAGGGPGGGTGSTGGSRGGSTGGGTGGGAGNTGGSTGGITGGSPGGITGGGAGGGAGSTGGGAGGITGGGASGPPVLGAILAGGAGRRMGGAVKAGLMLGGETLLARAARRLAPQCACLAVCAGPEPSRLAGFLPEGLPALPDPLPGHAGPLAGLLAALDRAAATGHEDVLTVAVDTPFFPGDLAARLAAGRRGAAVALAADAAGVHGTFGLWSAALAPSLRAAMAGGTRRVTDFAGAHGAVPVRFPGADAFFNVNRPEDLAVAETRL